MANKDMENFILNDSSFNKLVQDTVEKEFRQNLKSVKTSKDITYITDINKVPKSKFFTKDAIYEIINKNSHTRSFINGLQAEGYLATQNFDRTKLTSGLSDSFVNGDVFVKFVKVKV